MDADPRRVVVAVSPRLLGDALSVALRDRDLEVVVRLPDGDETEKNHFDLALVTAPLSESVDADVIIVLPTNFTEAAATVRHVSGIEERRAVGGLTDVLRLIDGLLDNAR